MVLPRVPYHYEDAARHDYGEDFSETVEEKVIVRFDEKKQSYYDSENKYIYSPAR